MDVSPDGHPEPAFLMRCDPDGWEKAVADGRWFYGQWRKIKKTWALMLGSLILGGVLTGIKDEIGGWVKAGIEKVTGKPGAQKPAEK
jgi:hypothetical protein